MKFLFLILMTLTCIYGHTYVLQGKFKSNGIEEENRIARDISDFDKNKLQTSNFMTTGEYKPNLIILMNLIILAAI